MNFCKGCELADFSNAKHVNDTYIHVDSDNGVRLVRLGIAKLPMCMSAYFLAKMGETDLPSKAIIFEDKTKGIFHHNVVETHYLGARIDGDTCSGNK